jgi:hypothetical protein
LPSSCPLPCLALSLYHFKPITLNLSNKPVSHSKKSKKSKKSGENGKTRLDDEQSDKDSDKDNKNQ